MPLIELRKELPADGIPAFGHSVFAIMLFPREQDRTRRDQWFAAAMARAARLRLPVDRPVDWQRWMATLWEMRGAPQAFFKSGIKRGNRASYSGMRLETMLRLAIHHPARLQVQQAEALIQEITQGGSSIQKGWSEYKTVAHLWAAWLILSRIRSESTPLGEDPIAVPKLLSVAERLRAMAERYRLLPPDVWRVPDGIKLLPIESDLPPIEDDGLAYLEQQFPG